MICDHVLLSCTTSWVWVGVLFTCIAHGFIQYWPWMPIILFRCFLLLRVDVVDVYASRVYSLYFLL